MLLHLVPPNHWEWKQRKNAYVQRAALYISLTKIANEGNDIKSTALTRQLKVSGQQGLDETSRTFSRWDSPAGTLELGDHCIHL